MKLVPIIRPAQSSDAEAILIIRNEPASLAISADPEPIPLAQHIAWFENKYFKQSGSLCFVAELDGVVVGYCRFDLDGDHYLISAAVPSSMHGRGIGTILYKQSLELLNPQIPVLGEPRKFNIISIKILERCGFKKISEDEKNFYYLFVKNHKDP